MKKELFDCMITCGEIDPDWYGHYKKDTIIREVVKHNVTQEEALAWHGSYECMKRVQVVYGSYHSTPYLFPRNSQPMPKLTERFDESLTNCS